MKEITVQRITEIVAQTMEEIAFVYPRDVYAKLLEARVNETGTQAIQALDILIENSKIAQKKHLPICQDTGMAIIFCTVGQEVHFDGNLREAINEGVRLAYRNGYLRNSVVNDPLFERLNTLDNTPALIYFDYVDGDTLTLEMAAKGFGSENMSRIKMCKPAEGVEGIKAFVLETVALAGPNACPPMVVGVGIGGSFDYAPRLAKHALLRELDEYHEDPKFKALEIELLEAINQLNIGPLGLKGKTTALKVNIETYPTHIAGMPVAVNINCHVNRHKKVVIE